MITPKHNLTIARMSGTLDSLLPSITFASAADCLYLNSLFIHVYHPIDGSAPKPCNYIINVTFFPLPNLPKSEIIQQKWF